MSNSVINRSLGDVPRPQDSFGASQPRKELPRSAKQLTDWMVDGHRWGLLKTQSKTNSKWPLVHRNRSLQKPRNPELIWEIIIYALD